MENGLLTKLLAVAIAAALLIVFRHVGKLWLNSAVNQKYHLTLWIRLLILGAIVFFVVWQFLPYRSVLDK